MIRDVLTELWTNRQRLLNLALYENKAKAGEFVLGRVWNVLNPALQIFVYWFVFSVGMGRGAKDGVPYAIWLTCGLLPWLALNNAMMKSAGSISAFSNTLKHIAFPLSLVPAKAVISAWIELLWSLALLLIITLAYGCGLSWVTFDLVYYYIAGFLFMLGFGLITSSITAVFMDFQQFLNPVIRLLFYVSNVIWEATDGAGAVAFILKLNPLTYLIDGFRNALIYHVPFWSSWKETTYFWAFTAVLMLIGCSLHGKLRKQFIDLI